MSDELRWRRIERLWARISKPPAAEHEAAIQREAKNDIISLLRSDVDQKRVLEQRLLFGTDWKMLAIEHKNNYYLTEFQQLMDKVQADANIPNLSRRFFGSNAVEFIGLRKGEAARRRLDAFYQQNKIAAPAWVQKVDAA